MKKAYSLICLLLLFLSMALPVKAEEAAVEDSLTLPEEILASLDPQPGDTLFCVYTVSYEAMAEYANIDEIFANQSQLRLNRYYFVRESAGEIHYYLYDSGCLEKRDHVPGWGAAWFDLHDGKAEAVIKKVSSDIVVENIYYLRGGDWDGIYYKTDLGDYVYIALDEKEYVMALEPFRALMGELSDLLTKYSVLSGMVGCPAYEPLISRIREDLSPYDISSPAFDPHTPLKIDCRPGKFIAIGSFVLLVVLVVCRCLIRGRGKYRKTKARLVNQF